MSFRTAGIHHVTGIASDPQRNLDFYAGILGFRLVKRTVNFDDPTTYHFYFGDESGNPGSILTFFPWPEARRGRQGGGQVAVTSFSILPSSVGFWIERLIKKRVEFEQPVARYEDERVIAFKDHEGFMGELVAHPAAATHAAWSGAGPSGVRSRSGMGHELAHESLVILERDDALVFVTRNGLLELNSLLDESLDPEADGAGKNRERGDGYLAAALSSPACIRPRKESENAARSSCYIAVVEVIGSRVVEVYGALDQPE